MAALCMSSGNARAGRGIGRAQFHSRLALGRGGAIAPSERITMGFIGVGTSGRRTFAGRRLDLCDRAVMPAARRSRFWPCATSGANGAKQATQKVNDHYREVYGEKFIPCQAYNDFRQVLDRKDIDAVLDRHARRIGTPP
jgi:hypothetical protein